MPPPPPPGGMLPPRWRLGIAPCLELLLDLPTYFVTIRGPGISGFTDVSPAPGAEVASRPYPRKNRPVVGDRRGATDWSPQHCWSGRAALSANALVMGTARRLGRKRHANGVFSPVGGGYPRITETTFAVEKKGDREGEPVFGVYWQLPRESSSSQFLNSDGLYRLSPTQQVDFHVAFGLNHNARGDT